MTRQVEIGVAGAIAPGERKRVFVDGRSIAVFNVDGALHAIDDSCPHNGASLGNGQLDGCVLRCPAHGLRFDLRTGATPGTGGLSVTTFEVATIDAKLVLMLGEQQDCHAAQQQPARHCATSQEKQPCKV